MTEPNREDKRLEIDALIEHIRELGQSFDKIIRIQSKTESADEDLPPEQKPGSGQEDALSEDGPDS